MSLVHLVQTEDATYEVTTDVRTRFLVMISGVAVDDITGAPLGVPFSITTSSPRAFTKTMANGVFSVAGVPELVFSNLTVGNTLLITMSAPGYRDASSLIVIPANPVFPIGVAPIVLRRHRIRLQGRVSEEAGAHNPIAGATVVSADPPGPPPPTHIVLLRAPLHLSHLPGVGLQGLALTPAGLPLPIRKLEAAAQAGDRTLTVNSRQNIVAGLIVRIGLASAGEYGVVEDVSAVPANPALPGDITLFTPIQRSSSAETPLDFFTAGANAGAPALLTRLGEAGDGAVFVNAFPGANVVEVNDPPQPKEYHDIGALTDADGFYHVDGLGRIPVLHLKVNAAGFTKPPGPDPWPIDYQQPVNILNFRMEP